MAKVVKTPFQLAQDAIADGTLVPPTVSAGKGNINYIGYQLAVHVHNLSILAIGMTMRGVKLTDLKKYYGLKGRSAKDCLEQLKAIQAEYKIQFDAAKVAVPA